MCQTLLPEDLPGVGSTLQSEGIDGFCGVFTSRWWAAFGWKGSACGFRKIGGLLLFFFFFSKVIGVIWVCMNIYSEPLFGVNVGLGMMIMIMMVMMSLLRGEDRRQTTATTVSFFLFGGGRTWEGSERVVQEECCHAVFWPSFLSLEKLTVSFAAMKGHHHICDVYFTKTILNFIIVS